MAKLELSSEQVNDFAHHIKHWVLWTARTPGTCLAGMSWAHFCQEFFACRNTRKIRIISLFLPQQFPNKVFVTKEQKVPCIFADLRTNSF